MFSERVLRWSTTALSSIIITVWGSLYAFPVYFEDLKAGLDLSQTQLNLVGSALYFGALFVGMPLAPMLRQYFKFVGGLLIGVISATLGYILLFYTVNGQITDSFSSVFIFAGMIGVSTGITYAQFPPEVMPLWELHYQQSVMVWWNVMYALGGFFATIYYALALAPEALELILALGIAHVSVGLGCGIPIMFLLRMSHKQRAQNEVQEHLLSDEEEVEVTNKKEPRKTNAAIPTWSDSFKKLVIDRRYPMLVLSLFLQVGVGSTFTINLSSFTVVMKANIIYANIIFAIAQTIGRMLLQVVYSIVSKMNNKRVSNGLPLIDATLPVLFILAVIQGSMNIMGASGMNDQLSFYIFVAIFGAAYGANWPIANLLYVVSGLPEAEAWDKFAAMSLPWGAVGTSVLNLIVGELFDSNEQRLGDCTLGNMTCYHEGFIVLACLSFLSSAVAVVLYFQNKRKRKEAEQQQLPAVMDLNEK